MPLRLINYSVILVIDVQKLNYPIKPCNAEIFICRPWRPNGFFSILGHYKCLSRVFPFYLNTFVIGQRLFIHIFSYSAEGMTFINNNIFQHMKFKIVWEK